MAAIFIHQILNHYTKREDLDPGLLVLDNSSNERPDWFEYWPIRRFLLNATLDEDSFYGFVSPKFKFKTNLSAAAAHAVIGRHSDADVVLLGQSVHLPAYYLNTFKYGDDLHPGLLELATQFFERIGRPTDLNTLITTSRNEVYSNFFTATPRFWRAWLDVTEKLFAIAESPDDELGARLRAGTSYRRRRDFPMKIFIVERIATWLIVRDSQFIARAGDPFVARSRRYKLPGAIVCDALKIAYLETGRADPYMRLFDLVSALRPVLNWFIRCGIFWRVKPVRVCLQALSSYWTRAGES